MLGGITSLSLSASTPQLLSTSQAQNALLRLTGVLLAHIVISPDTGVLMTGFYYFENLTTGSFSVTFTNTGGSVVLPQGRRGVLWIDTINGPRVMSSVGSAQTDIIQSGSVQPFYNSAAPTGWTILALNDYALQVVTSGGGTASGSVAYSTLFGRTATDNHTLTTAQLAAHSHGVVNGGGGTPIVGAASSSNFNLSGSSTAPFGATTISVQNAGGSEPHSHNIDMRVQTAKVLLATRN